VCNGIPAVVDTTSTGARREWGLPLPDARRCIIFGSQSTLMLRFKLFPVEEEEEEEEEFIYHK